MSFAQTLEQTNTASENWQDIFLKSAKNVAKEGKIWLIQL